MDNTSTQHPEAGVGDPDLRRLEITPDRDNEDGRPHEPERGGPIDEEGTFKREGPEPPATDTGEDIDEMNNKAEKSLVSNVRPDESAD
jgi:hypothetical protein